MQALLFEVLLKETLRLSEICDPSVVLEELLHILLPTGHKVVRHNFNDRKDCCLIEIVQKCLSLLRHGQVVTTREKV